MTTKRTGILRTQLTDLLDRVDPRRIGAYEAAEFDARKAALETRIRELREVVNAGNPDLLNKTADELLQIMDAARTMFHKVEEYTLEDIAQELAERRGRYELLDQERLRLEQGKNAAEALEPFLQTYILLQRAAALAAKDTTAVEDVQRQSELNTQYETIMAELESLRLQIQERESDLRPLLETRGQLMDEIETLLSEDHPSGISVRLSESNRDTETLMRMFEGFWLRVKEMEGRVALLRAKQAQLEEIVKRNQKEIDALNHPDVMNHQKWLQKLRELGQALAESADAPDIFLDLRRAVNYKRRKEQK